MTMEAPINVCVLVGSLRKASLARRTFENRARILLSFA
jgi:hypothetical protein